VRIDCYRNHYILLDEIDTEAKIERMRREVKKLQNLCVSMNNTVYALRRHHHSGADVLVPLDCSIGSRDSNERRPEKYF
jgi:hypothetical protein